jgi:hypothetical protein
LVAGLSSPGVAFAYLDPGSGSFVFQILLGILFTVTFAFRKAWGAIVFTLGKYLRRLLPDGLRKRS